MNLQNSSYTLRNNFINILKGLLVSVILLYFTSCNEVDSIGSSFQDEGILLNTYFADTFTVESSVFYVDSVITSGNLLVGAETDEKFGQTTTESFFKLFVPSEYNESFTNADNDATFDSAKLVLSYSVLSGDGSVSQDLELYTINELINDTILYYQRDRIQDINNIPDGLITLVPEEDTLKLLQIDANGIGQTLFSNRTSANILTQELFEENIFKGINIRPSNPDLDAYTLNIAPASASSLNFSFQVYFSVPEDTISRLQTFFIGTSFYSVDADFSNTEYLSGLEAGGKISTTLTNNECYLQAGVGLTTQLTFPGLADFADKNPNIAINKAELTFDPIESSIEEYGIPPETLSFYVLDENGDYDENVLLLQEGRSPEPVSTLLVQNTPVLTLSYGQGSGTYPVADITSYIQEVLSGNLPNHGLLINPFLRRGSISRCIFGDNQNPQTQLKLRLFYTENTSRD